jgi:hypothetical protein
MYSLETYLKSVAPRLSWITNADKQIIPVAGLDRAASVLQNYADNAYPIVLVEDATGGKISYEAEFLNVSVHNFWVMNKSENPDRAEERKKVMDKCYEQALEILKIIVEDAEDITPGWNRKTTRWDRKQTAYMPVSNIGLCYGWLFMLTFITDLNLK